MHQQLHVVGRPRWRLGRVVLGDGAADDDARAAREPQQAGVEDLPADVVEEDVDAVGRGLAQLRSAGRRPCSRSRRRSRARRRASRHFSGPPAIPTARQPLIRAIWPTMLPTEPAAPETTTVCPGSGRPTSSSPKYAVRPLIPSAPRCTGGAAQARCRRGSRRCRPRPRSAARRTRRDTVVADLRSRGGATRRRGRSPAARMTSPIPTGGT